VRKTQGAGSRASRDPELVGDVPKLATSQDLLGANPPLTGRSHAKTSGNRSRSARGPGTINLKTVAEACITAGLDPAEAIAKALTTKVQARDRMGQLVYDDDGRPVLIDAVDPDTRLRTLQELLQYTQPKLKAVEVKMSGHLELSSEQLDQRLAALLAKADGGR
jgi:hypothetical protein